MKEKNKEDSVLSKILKKAGLGLVGYLLVTLFGGLVGIIIAVLIYLGYRWFNNQEQQKNDE